MIPWGDLVVPTGSWTSTRSTSGQVFRTETFLSCEKENHDFDSDSDDGDTQVKSKLGYH